MSTSQTAPSPVGSMRASRWAMPMVGAFALLGAFRLLFPGDIRFVNDEPHLLARALEADSAGTVVWTGLMGTRGVRYGPAPTWFYQLGLLLTSDPRWIAFARIVLITVVTGVALALLARNLRRLRPLLAAFAFLSPYLWIYSRDLWDNSFTIPLSAIFLATYVQFCTSDRVRWLAAAGISGVLCVLTHLMTLPLLAAVGVHFVATRWRAMLRSPRLGLGAVAIALLCFALCWPYLREIGGGMSAGVSLTRRPRSLLFALNGTRFFTLAGFDYFIGAWRLGGLGPAMRLISLFSYVPTAYGLYLWSRAVEADDAAERQVGTLVLLALLFFIVMANAKTLSVHPHYYNGMWIVFFLLWWKGMTGLMRQAWARRAFFGQAAVMGAFLLGVAAWLHVNHGTKTLRYGPTLGNQMAVARELDSLGAVASPPTRALAPRVFPHAIRVLRRLDRRGGGVEAQGPGRTDALIEYADSAGKSGELVVRTVTPSPASEPSGAPGQGGSSPPHPGPVPVTFSTRIPSRPSLTPVVTEARHYHRSAATYLP